MILNIFKVLFIGLLQFIWVIGKPTSSPLTFSVVSWNLAERIPVDQDVGFLKELKSDDIVILGAQECEDVKFRRHEGHKSRAWHALQKKSLGKSYKNIASGSLGGIKLDIYVKNSLKNTVKLVKVVDVPCGIGNVLGNKGGVCAVFNINGYYIAVINSHFAAHQNKVEARNQDYSRIVTTMSAKLRDEIEELNRRLLKKKRAQKRGAVKVDGQSVIDLFEFQRDLELRLGRKIPLQSHIEEKVAERFDSRFDENETGDAAFNNLFDAIIFLGDFNYRLNVPRLEIELAREKLRAEECPRGSGTLAKAAYDMECIMEYDQLHKERSMGKVFTMYNEDRIDFIPTYKFDKNSEMS